MWCGCNNPTVYVFVKIEAGIRRLEEGWRGGRDWGNILCLTHAGQCVKIGLLRQKIYFLIEEEFDENTIRKR